MDRFQLVHTWEQSSELYVQYMLNEKVTLPQQLVLNSSGNLFKYHSDTRLVTRSELDNLNRFVRARVLDTHRVREVYTSIHYVEYCINIDEYRRLSALQYELTYNSPDGERQFKEMTDKVTTRFSFKQYHVVLSEDSTLIMFPNDVRKIMGEVLFEELTNSPYNY